MTRHANTPAPKTADAKPEQADKDGLEERIERLEKRLEETIASPEPPHVLVKKTLEDDQETDPLRRAVERVSARRDQSK